MMKKIIYNLSLIGRGIKLLFYIEGSFVLFHVISCILTPVVPYINIYFMAKIVNELVDLRRTERLIFYVTTTIVLNFIFILIINVLNQLKKYRLNQFYKNEKMMFAEKTMGLDYKKLESFEVKSLFERINIENQSGHNTYFLYTFFGKAISNIISIIIAIILSYNLFFSSSIVNMSKFILIILLFINVIFNAFSNYKTNNLMIKYFDKCLALGARFGFFYNLYKDYKVGKDVRLYKMKDYIMQIQCKDDEYYNNSLLETQKKSLKFNLSKQLLTDFTNIIIYILLIIVCFNGNLQIGDIAKYVSCILLFVINASELVNQIQSLLDNNKYLENYFNYLDISSEIESGDKDISNQEMIKIEFKNVSFKYPNSENYALKNFSITFNLGKRYAIVGMNGSGKTTIIKLLCRLYNPSEGVILLNEVDIKEYDYRKYLDLLSVVFQDFKLFSFSLAQNIASNDKYEDGKVMTMIEKVGLSSWLNTLPKGIDTPIYKDFDGEGVEVSGGEEQKIAIARAIYKNAPIIILDEPTASLDPISEADIYVQFNKAVQEKLAIFISHRLSSCLFCDSIIVIHNGELIQMGSHDELVTQIDKKYYEMWKAQEEYYNI